MQCYFCGQAAVTIGWGFAVCGGRPDGEVNCAERARTLFERTITERAQRRQS